MAFLKLVTESKNLKQPFPDDFCITKASTLMLSVGSDCQSHLSPEHWPVDQRYLWLPQPPFCLAGRKKRLSFGKNGLGNVRDGSVENVLLGEGVAVLFTSGSSYFQQYHKLDANFKCTSFLQKCLGVGLISSDFCVKN